MINEHLISTAFTGYESVREMLIRSCRTTDMPQQLRNSSKQTRLFSIDAQDLLRIGERWWLMIGLRFDHIDQMGQRRCDELAVRSNIQRNQSAHRDRFQTSAELVVVRDLQWISRPDGSGLPPIKSEAVESAVTWQVSYYLISIALWSSLHNNRHYRYAEKSRI